MKAKGIPVTDQPQPDGPTQAQDVDADAAAALAAQAGQLPETIIQSQVNVGQVPGPDGRMRVILNVTTSFLLTPKAARAMGVELQRLGSAGDLVIPGKDGGS